MSWKCAKCNQVNRDDDAAICGNCRKPNPNRNRHDPSTPEASWLGRVTCPHCGYSNASGSAKTCYRCGKKLRPGT
jgi:DNA-directed RNA polymerase subunit RPC12/RpoP